MITDVVEVETETEKDESAEEWSCIHDKIMIGLGIFVFLCVLCIILLFTISIVYDTNTNHDNHHNHTVTIPTPNVTKTTPKISGNYNTTDSYIYFIQGTSRIIFAEHTKMNVFMVGGGGGASYGGGWITGGSGTGGGGGGCVGEGVLVFTANVAYEIIIGNGGRMNRNKIAEKGGNTMISGDDIHEVAEGGGYGGYYYYNSVGGGSYGYSGQMSASGVMYNFTNPFLGQSVQGRGTLTYHSHSGGGGLNNHHDKNPGSGGGGAGGPGHVPLEGEGYEKRDGSFTGVSLSYPGDLSKGYGGKGGECYVWNINQECYGSGGDGGSTLSEQNVTRQPLPNTGGGGSGASTSGPQTSTSGSSGIVILSYT